MYAPCCENHVSSSYVAGLGFELECKICGLSAVGKSQGDLVKAWEEALQSKSKKTIEVDTEFWDPSLDCLYKDGKYDFLGAWALSRGIPPSLLEGKSLLTNALPRIPDDLQWLEQTATWGKMQMSAQLLLIYIQKNYNKKLAMSNIEKVLKAAGLSVAWK